MSMHVCAICVKVFPEARRELELQVVMNCPVWVLGAELRSSLEHKTAIATALPHKLRLVVIVVKDFPKT